MNDKPTGDRKRLPAMEAAMTPEGRETYHVEDGTLPCWCDIGRDHTMKEFFAWLDAQRFTEDGDLVEYDEDGITPVDIDTEGDHPELK